MHPVGVSDLRAQLQVVMVEWLALAVALKIGWSISAVIRCNAGLYNKIGAEPMIDSTV